MSGFNIFMIPDLMLLADTVKAKLATGISLKSIGGVLTDPKLISTFEHLGESLFPSIAPELRTAAAIVTTFNPDRTKWLQGVLNQVVVPSPNLDVDGNYGPSTRTAVEALQEQLGLKKDGWAGDITEAALKLAIAKEETIIVKTN